MTKTTQASSSAQQAMETLTAQWYNAVVAACDQERSSFQLMQGNVAVGSTSEDLWNIFDVVPPLSISNYYNPSQANVFSQDYGSVVNNLVPQNSNAFENDMGDYYAQWTAYLKSSPSPTIPSPGGILQLFQNWSQLNMPPNQAQQCYTDYQEVAQGVVPVAVQMWLNAGGAPTQKAYNQTINDLNSALQGTRGRNVTMNSATETSDVSDTWASGEVGGWADFFAGEGGGDWDDFTTSIAQAGLTIEADFQHLAQFTAGPLAKVSQDPILSTYQPWYCEPALNLAYKEDNNTVWQHSAPTWDDTFGDNGNLLRTTSALVVVDGVTIKISSSATFNSAQQQEIQAQVKVGFWPFFEATSSGGWTNDVEFDDTGAITVTSTSPTGNPQVLGATVTPIADALGNGND